LRNCHPAPLPGYFRREAGRGLLKDKFILRESSGGGASFLAKDLIKKLDEKTNCFVWGLKLAHGTFPQKIFIIVTAKNI